jgi:hypothetical protein
MIPIHFFYNKACNWSIEFLQIVNISKLYHILGSNHSMFYMWSFQVLYPYKFLVLKMRTLLFTKYIWKTITFHCLPSSRCSEVSYEKEKLSTLDVDVRWPGNEGMWGRGRTVALQRTWSCCHPWPGGATKAL